MLGLVTKRTLGAVEETYRRKFEEAEKHLVKLGRDIGRLKQQVAELPGNSYQVSDTTVTTADIVKIVIDRLEPVIASRITVAIDDLDLSAISDKIFDGADISSEEWIEKIAMVLKERVLEQLDFQALIAQIAWLYLDGVDMGDMEEAVAEQVAGRLEVHLRLSDQS